MRKPRVKQYACFGTHNMWVFEATDIDNLLAELEDSDAGEQPQTYEVYESGSARAWEVMHVQTTWNDGHYEAHELTTTAKEVSDG